MTYRVELTEQAEHDVDHILGWISNRSPQGAATWSRRFDKVLSKLRTSPDRGQLPPENNDHDAEIRHIVFKTRRGRPYRAVFVIRDDMVLVLHVRGPGQDIMRPDELRFPE